MLAHGQWFPTDTPTSSTTKTGRHDITEILLKVALKLLNSLSHLCPYNWNDYIETWYVLYSYLIEYCKISQHFPLYHCQVLWLPRQTFQWQQIKIFTKIVLLKKKN
jgi:hypothetical protein